MTGTELADAARALVGTPFRLHGRDPRVGLDCVGVLAAALGEINRLPNGYRMRGGDLDWIAREAAAAGLCPTIGPSETGDVVLLRPGPCQRHLAIISGTGMIIHAHAGLRRVVQGPLPPDWPILGHWRLPS